MCLRCVNTYLNNFICNNGNIDMREFKIKWENIRNLKFINNCKSIKWMLFDINDLEKHDFYKHYHTLHEDTNALEKCDFDACDLSDSNNNSYDSNNDDDFDACDLSDSSDNSYDLNYDIDDLKQISSL